VLGHQQLDGVVHQLVRLSLVDARQAIASNGAQLATEPGVGPACVGVDSVGDELLAVAEKFETVNLAAGTGRDQKGRDLLERRVGAEGNCALRRLAHPRQQHAAVGVAVAHQLLDRVGCRLIWNVDVEGRRPLGQHARVGLVPPLRRPADNVFACAVC
jgi:hypothetical protein